MIALRICRAALLASALLPSIAWAGAGTITTKNAAGSTITFVTVTDGSTNNLAASVLCDGVAGANCVTVKAASTAAAQTDLALVMRNPDLVTGLADAACATDNGTCTVAQLIKRGNQTLTLINAGVGASVPAGTFRIGYTSDDPCTQLIKTNVPISMTGTTTVKLVSLSGGKKIYICALNLRASAATVWSIADGTKVTTECDTTAEAVIGAAIATHGLSEIANGGNTYGSGNGTVALTNTVSHDLCLFQSGAGDLSGNITYVQQ